MELYEKPQKSRIILGFPGFGLIGTITTEFLVEHLETRLIGRILLNNMPSTVAIHKGKIIEPIGIYYNKKYNIVIINGLVSLSGLEWELSE
ncbi:MAG: PAC2 family protein, partial [Candidatus Woesearchaeota archaeon]